MKIYLSPYISDKKSLIKINGEQVQVDDKLYDFTNLPNGALRIATVDILSAKRVNGELHAEVINRLDNTATQDELFPQWQTIGHNDVLDDDLTLVELDWYSDDARVSDELLASLEPTKEELEQAEFEIKLITKSAEWGIL